MASVPGPFGVLGYENWLVLGMTLVMGHERTPTPASQQVSTSPMGPLYPVGASYRTGQQATMCRSCGSSHSREMVLWVLPTASLTSHAPLSASPTPTLESSPDYSWLTAPRHSLPCVAMYPHLWSTYSSPRPSCLMNTGVEGLSVLRGLQRWGSGHLFPSAETICSDWSQMQSTGPVQPTPAQNNPLAPDSS